MRITLTIEDAPTTEAPHHVACTHTIEGAAPSVALLMGMALLETVGRINADLARCPQVADAALAEQVEGVRCPH